MAFFNSMIDVLQALVNQAFFVCQKSACIGHLKLKETKTQVRKPKSMYFEPLVQLSVATISAQ